MRWIKIILFAAGLTTLSCLASAQDNPTEGPLTAKLAVASVVIDPATNKEVLKPAGTAAPGDTLQYTSSYSNVSGQPLSGLIVNGQIPPNTTFLPSGLSISQDATLEVLIDGESWQELPAYKTVTREDGTTERVKATEADYKQIRWQLAGPLEAGESLVTTYRVQVNN